MLTLLTATGARPQAWAICEELMRRQDYTGPVHWIIVDDGETPQPVMFEREGWTLERVLATPVWRPGQNTQARNLAEGLRRVKPGAKLVIIEDDDAYAPDYLTWISGQLDHADLVGESHARYYNVATRQARQLSNAKHASLCSTAMKGPAILEFKRQLKPGVQFIDINLWREFKGSTSLVSGRRVVGIKGMPGRGGIGMGHKQDFRGVSDRSGELLKQWTGSNADLYTS